MLQIPRAPNLNIWNIIQSFNKASFLIVGHSEEQLSSLVDPIQPVIQQVSGVFTFPKPLVKVLL